MIEVDGDSYLVGIEHLYAHVFDWHFYNDIYDDREPADVMVLGIRVKVPDAEAMSQVHSYLSMLVLGQRIKRNIGLSFLMNTIRRRATQRLTLRYKQIDLEGDTLTIVLPYPVKLRLMSFRVDTDVLPDLMQREDLVFQASEDLANFYGVRLKPETRHEEEVDQAALYQLSEENPAERQPWLPEPPQSLRSTYESVDQYVSIMKPLFFAEMKASLHRSFKTMEPQYTEACSLVAKPEPLVYVQQRELGEFLNLQMIRTCNPGMTFQYLSTGEMAILSLDADPRIDTERHLFCVVHEVTGMTRLSLVVRLDNLGPRAPTLLAALLSSEEWFITALSGTITFRRQFAALMNVRQSSHLNVLLKAQSDPRQDAQQVSPLLRGKLEERLNSYQLRALDSCQYPHGFFVVQGPPGTGKTTTILGILSALLFSGDEEATLSEADKPEIPSPMAHQSKKPKRNRSPSPQMFGDWLASLKSEKRPKIQTISGQDRPNVQPILSETADTSMREIGLAGRFCRYDPVKDAAGLLPRTPLGYDVKTIRKRKKILVCAPSNAAVDGILNKLVEVGILNDRGLPYKPFVTRLGPNIDGKLADYGIEAMSNDSFQRLSADKKHALGKDAVNHAKRMVLSECDVICATLAMVGGRDMFFLGDQTLDAVVVDEAAQCIELDILIALMHSPQRVILVGDPVQLPATTFSKIANEGKYNMSLIGRLQSNAYDYVMLSEQYRMHPEIAEFSAMCFYDGELQSSQNILQIVGHPPRYEYEVFKPLVFFDLKGITTKDKESFSNKEEAYFILYLLTKLQTMYPGDDWTSKTGIITPYLGQVQLLNTVLGENKFENVEVSTVDGFQGREKDVIILSLVRANPLDGIGFVNNEQRMNVMLTRAKQNLFVVGCADALSGGNLRKNMTETQVNTCWVDFIDLCEKMDRLFVVDNPIKTFFDRTVPEESTQPDANLMDLLS